MIPTIRSITELMAVTESRDNRNKEAKDNELESSIIDSGQRKRYIRSLYKDKVNLPNLKISKSRKYTHKEDLISKLLDRLDYNNQIQPSYDLTLLARQNDSKQQDAA